MCFSITSGILGTNAGPTDHSLPVDDPTRVRDGTIADILDCALDHTAKILSATGFPLIGRGWNTGPYSSDHVAWSATQGMPFAKADIPVGDFTFGNAASEGAMFWWKFAPHGLGTTLKVTHGSLLLVLGRPKEPWEANTPCSYDSYDAFSDFSFLEKFTETDPSHDAWIPEAVYLDTTTDL